MNKNVSSIVNKYMKSFYGVLIYTDGLFKEVYNSDTDVNEIKIFTTLENAKKFLHEMLLMLCERFIERNWKKSHDTRDRWLNDLELVKKDNTLESIEDLIRQIHDDDFGSTRIKWFINELKFD